MASERPVGLRGRVHAELRASGSTFTYNQYGVADTSGTVTAATLAWWAWWR